MTSRATHRLGCCGSFCGWNSPTQRPLRIYKRSDLIDELEKLTAGVAPMAYDIESYASLGLLWKLLRVEQPNAPTAADLQTVRSDRRAGEIDCRSSTDGV